VGVDRATATWILASPALFLLHELEEYRTMIPWVREHSAQIPAFIRNLVPATASYLAYGAVIFFVVFTIAGILAVRSRPLSMSFTLFAILLLARLENGLFHIVQSLLLRTYTPGVITAALIVCPL
jgi:hypothetical protein